jgi:hypothetical protein
MFFPAVPLLPIRTSESGLVDSNHNGTISQRCNKLWKKFQAEQIKICLDFIEKYGVK